MRSWGLLLWNEWIKLWKRPGFFVPYLLLAILAGGSAVIIHSIKADLFASGFDFTTGMLAPSGSGLLILILAVSSSVKIVTQEYRYGTIKFLLIRSHSRASILTAKLAVSLLYTLTFTLFAFLAFFLAGGTTFGFTMAAGDTWNQLLLAGVYEWIFLVIYVLIALMIAVLTRSGGKAIGMGIFIAMLNDLSIPKPFFKYVLFPNTDLSVYAAGHPPMAGMTLGFSATMLAIYAGLVIGISYLLFCKRDVS
ncbi:ABC transporter permease [Gorillibacterium sp. CAU 1737]|uniref:ABC transporter permease n=1 Tax=Gorillibacterium sp. CAU 1737 TaxID=3140362 RepID=UPI0032617F0A